MRSTIIATKTVVIENILPPYIYNRKSIYTASARNWESVYNYEYNTLMSKGLDHNSTMFFKPTRYIF